jgi:ParB/RepB/Spo0J family partition protein
MQIARTKITEDVRDIIARSSVAGQSLVLPEQLDRATYVKVDKVLKAVGGKWNRKAAAHVFDFDPRDLIGVAVAEGNFVDKKRTLQFFETPDGLAADMVDLAQVLPGSWVLEPSAGRGRILRHILVAGARVDAVEIDPDNCAALEAMGRLPQLMVYERAFEDFCEGSAGGYDAVIMNPPFAGNLDISHIRDAWDLLNPGGRLVAVCSEGPFFRQDARAFNFRAWLDEIGATYTPLAEDTFRESGTSVGTRLIVATKAAIRTAPEPEPEGPIRMLDLAQVRPDPGQPRKVFDKAGLRDLANSIEADGLLQPITVRADGDSFVIVAGERRYRASLMIGRKTIRAMVIVPKDQADIRVKQIIENDQRVDVTPMEQARSYQNLMDETGMTVEQLAARVGKPVHRITERTVLLTLKPEHQHLLESGNLKPGEAYEMTRLDSRGQDLLFTAIRTGRCKSFADVKAMADAIIATKAQAALWAEPEPASEAERHQASVFEQGVEKVAALLRAGIRDNQVVAVRRVNPDRAEHLANLMAAMQKDMRRIELALREVAVQLEMAS